MLAQPGRHGIETVVESHMVCGAVGGAYLLSGIQLGERGHVQEVQFRAMLPGNERCPLHGAVGRIGRIGSGDDGDDGLHETLLVVSQRRRPR